MLEHIPAWLGRALQPVRAGSDRLVIADSSLVLPVETLDLSSPAFADRGTLPARFTADGEGVSPPLSWTDPPDATRSFALIVEDPDAPFPNPLVHAILWDIPASTRGLPEGAIAVDRESGTDGEIGRNSFLRQGWLPPDPPNGHGSHDYVFQLFALSEAVPLSAVPGRGAVVAALAGRIQAAGILIGTYARD